MCHSKRKDRDFHNEIESHIQLEAERLREQGLSVEEARAAARRAARVDPASTLRHE